MSSPTMQRRENWHQKAEELPSVSEASASPAHTQCSTALKLFYGLHSTESRVYNGTKFSYQPIVHSHRQEPAIRTGLAHVPLEPRAKEDLGRHLPSDQQQLGKPSTNCANRDPTPPGPSPALSGMDLVVLLH